MITNRLEEVYDQTITIKDLFNVICLEIEREGGPAKAKLAQAMCRDDSVDELSAERLSRGYSGIFDMRTLTGLPVFGQVGMTAFYHHIPDGGIGVIIYAPHVGIDSQGRWGFLDRLGIKEVGKSCGANQVILTKLATGNYQSELENPELSAVVTKLLPYTGRILQSLVPIREIMEVEYELGLKMLTEMITRIQTSEHHQFPILLLAGVNIDTHYHEENRFQLRKIIRFENSKIAQEIDYLNREH